MRVLAVTPLYPPGNPVGSWLSTHECLKELAARGHRVTVMSSLAGGKPYHIDGIRVVPGLNGLERRVREADVVVTHFGDQTTADAEARKRSKPLVKMVHGWVHENAWRPLRANPPALTVWNSRSLLAEAKYEEGESVVVHPPMDPEDYRTTPGDRVTLVNLSEAKGVGTFYRVSQWMRSTFFLGVHGAYGGQRTIRGMNIKIQPLTTNMRDDVYARTRVLMVPSVLETWGRVGIEAMCSGIPVLAHPTPGLRESLGDAGIFIDRKDTKGWRDEIERLKDPAEYEVASKLALDRVEELQPHTWAPSFADAVEKLIL